ncbi:MAG: hypothetical protein MI745_06695 [Pseudomonadales bacterium]|nr:hypothetical protein [Pseudomonadales bacterium]
MSIFGDIWGKLDEGLDTLGNAAGDVFDAAKNQVVNKLNEEPANVSRPETIPDQVPNPTTVGPTPTNPAGQVWQQYKVPIMVGSALLAGFLIYTAVKD